MRRLSFGLILTVLLAIVAGAGGSWMSAKYVFQQRHTVSLHEFVHEKLDLSTAQERQIDVLEQDFAVRRRAREAELRAANAELAAAIQAEHEYSPRVQAAVERFHHAMGTLQSETVQHILAMRKVMTPQQALQFDRRISEALTEQAL